MRTLRIFWLLALIPNRHLFALIANTWDICIPMSADSRNTSTSLLSRLFLDFNLMITAAKLHIPLFRLPPVYHLVFLTFLETKIFPVWFLVALIKTPISAWPEMFVLSSKRLNLQDFIVNSFLLCRVSTQRCQDLFLPQEFLWPTNPNRYKQR